MFHAILAVLFTRAFANLTSAPANRTNSTFKDFMEKYDPSTVWEQMEKYQLQYGANFSRAEEFDRFFKGIDPTDELLRFPVVNGDTRILLQKSGRRWRPPGKLLMEHSHDRWSLRPRLYELMKQAIYQARNKMVLMQTIREQKRKNALYKMGFLFAKTDLIAKTFASFAKKSYRACSMKEQYVSSYLKTPFQYFIMDIVHTHERLMQLWFDIDLMVDIIDRNGVLGQRVLEKYSGPDRIKAFNALFKN